MRGDYLPCASSHLLRCGPSPHAWGLRYGVHAGSAYAAGHPHMRGDYGPPGLGGPRGAGHPHMRGDYGGVSSSPTALSGHPHMRGDYGSRRVWCRTHRRAIPTCVGTTPRASRWSIRPLGHPHMRGDYGGFGGSEERTLGPSPHAWGLRTTGLGPPSSLRAIPTCVGTTRGQGGPATSPAGHPHMRGDYTSPPEYHGPRGGPSPHAWGLRPVQKFTPGFHRAIPTCVGTTGLSVSGFGP